MADPEGYERSYSFTSYQTTHQDTPIPGPELDNEFENIERAIGETQDALADVRRSDGRLANQSVGPDQLSPALTIGFTNRGAWTDGESYSAGDGVFYSSDFYSARVQHVASALNRPDVDSTTWMFLFGTVGIADGAITTAKLADQAVETAKIDDGAVTAAKIGAGAVETAKLADQAVETAKIDDGAVTAAKQTGLGVLADENEWTDENTFRDEMLLFVDPSDPTKRARLDVERVTAGQTRVLTVPDRDINVASVPRGYLYGLELSNNASDATNDIDIAVGEAANDDSVAWNMVLDSALTKRLDAGWAVGSNQGGLDTGSIANTTYHVFLIQRSDTGVVDALFSISPTAPTMPANYDRKRRIGSIVRTGGAIKAFFQTGNVFSWADPVTDVNTSNPGTSAVTTAITLPTGLILEAFGDVNHGSNVAAADQVVYITDLRQTNAGPDITQYFTGIHRSTGALIRTATSWRVFCNASAQIRYRVNNSDANTNIRISTKGWIDTRGRV